MSAGCQGCLPYVSLYKYLVCEIQMSFLKMMLEQRLEKGRVALNALLYRIVVQLVVYMWWHF